MSNPRKRILVLGGLGMLGHQLYGTLKADYDVRVTIRGTWDAVKHLGVFEEQDLVEQVDVMDFDSVVRAFAESQPEIVINAIGLVKQLALASDPLYAISLNSLFPHRLAALCSMARARLIHISTDCVFSGKKGNYRDDDQSDAEDLYGRSKFLGEVSYPHCLTMRTSIIGREIKNKVGLLEWFLNAKEDVSGYRNVLYNGLTTLELARTLGSHVIPDPTLSGVYNVSSAPISKYDLLCLLKEIYGLTTVIHSDTSFVCDRTLNSERFQQRTGYRSPAWHSMLEEMHNYHKERHEFHR